MVLNMTHGCLVIAVVCGWPLHVGEGNMAHEPLAVRRSIDDITHLDQSNASQHVNLHWTVNKLHDTKDL